MNHVLQVNEKTRMEKELWYIWSNEHRAWWKPGHRGYTENFKEAGKYPYVEALRIVHGANEHQDKNHVPYIPNEAMVKVDEELQTMQFRGAIVAVNATA